MEETKYIVEKNFGSLNCTCLIDPVINRQASQYCAEHRDELVRRARMISGVDPSKAEDLVDDVFLSIITAENEGDGYDISHSNAGDVISVSDFVLGRIKGYAKNKRYSIEGSDRHLKNSSDEKGTKVADFDIVFASSNSGDPDDMNGVQLAYHNAHKYEDELDAVEDQIALRQSIEFCIDFSEAVRFDFLNMFKNIDIFSGDFDKSIFDGLIEQLKHHNELSDALYNVIECAVKHRDIYDSVLATF